MNSTKHQETQANFDSKGKGELKVETEFTTNPSDLFLCSDRIDTHLTLDKQRQLNIEKMSKKNKSNIIQVLNKQSNMNSSFSNSNAI